MSTPIPALPETAVPARIEIARPVMGEAEERAVIAVLRSGRLTQGPAVEAFESVFAATCGASHAVAVGTGTAALLAALVAHGIGPGDEVVVPSFTFVATASAVLAAGATPVFADIDPATFCLSPAAAAAAIGPRTAAILPVHLYGHPAALGAFRTLCQARHLLLVEDAAQAHGAVLDGKRIGSSGTVAFSFHASKNITTGEGGMVLTEDAAVAERVRGLRDHGGGGAGRWAAGGNLRMTELSAAVGRVQVDVLAEWNRLRAANAAYYDRHLSSVVTPWRAPEAVHAWHQYTVRVRTPLLRDRVLARLDGRGIGARAYYATPIHRRADVALAVGPAVRAIDLPETDRAAAEVLSLPVHPHLSEADLARVVAEVEAACR